jgi:hypothetical protein
MQASIHEDNCSILKRIDNPSLPNRFPFSEGYMGEPKRSRVFAIEKLIKKVNNLSVLDPSLPEGSIYDYNHTTYY